MAGGLGVSAKLVHGWLTRNVFPPSKLAVPYRIGS